MAFYDKFPYTNFQELNLDKIIQALKTMQEELKEFINNNVIKYADPIQWDITKQYEANTVVADSEGNAYLSSQPVPVGVALSNTEYWSQIGNFDALFTVIKNAITPHGVPMLGEPAQEDHYAGDLLWVGDELYGATVDIHTGDTIAAGTNVQIKDVNARIWDILTTANNAVSTLRSDMNTADNELSATITANQNSNNARFTAIENQLTTLQDKYYVFIGDSFAEGWTPDGNTTPYWSLFKTHYNIPNDHLYTSHIGGAAFTQGTRFLSLLQNLYSTIPDRSKITDIYLLGGRNDFGHSIADIKEKRNEFITYAKLNYPNAVIHIGFVGKSFERTADTTMSTQYNTFLGYKEECEMAGGVYMNGIESALADSAMFASDRKHPNQDGQNSLYNALVSLAETNTYTFIRQIYPTLTFPSGTSGTAGDIAMSAYGHETKMVFSPRNLAVNLQNANLNRQPFVLGKLDRTLGDCRNYNSYNTTATAVIKIDNKFWTLPVLVSMIENEIRLFFTMTTDAHNAYVSGNITELQLGGFILNYNNVRGD